MEVSRVSVHPNPMEADLVRVLLLDLGLHPLPIQGSAYVGIAGAQQAIPVFVPEPELKEAQAFLRGTPYEKAIWDDPGD